MGDRISEERLRNTRNWAAARIGTLSGAEVIVGAIDELLELRAALDRPHLLERADWDNPIIDNALRKLGSPDQEGESRDVS